MGNILYELFSGDYDITSKPDERQQKLCAQIYAELDKVEAVLGDEYLDCLLRLDSERVERQSFQYYRSGFLLGTRLMLEALGPGL